jgi:L-arabinokinase
MTVFCWQGEAPGRLDVLGGVADYSGALVLQTPIRATTRVTITPRAASGLELHSASEGRVTVPMPEVSLWQGHDTGPQRGADKGSVLFRTWLDGHRVQRWARYPLGCFLLFCGAMEWQPADGLHFQIASDVPVSMGVSSSAALEVATLRALEAASGRRFQGTAEARLAQRAENEIVDAPCGLMDQLAATHGKHGALLPILCRPDVLAEPVPLPDGVLVVGWPSGVKHAVSASPYATARAAAFMGKKILEVHLDRPLGYLTEFSPSQVREVSEKVLPPTLSGAEFVALHGGVEDALSVIDPGRLYPIRAAVLFAVEENFRATQAVHLLRSFPDGERRPILQVIGELIYQSHTGYSAIGLGCAKTDAMVEAVRERGAGSGLYGARVSGGGSGGTVVVLLEKDALPELERLARTVVFGMNGPAPLIA